MADAHPGFKAVQAKIASKEGIGERAAGAILANSTRNASPEAKAKNPRLDRVKGDAISRRMEKNKKSRGN
jgi:hypothetical protein